MIKNIKIEAAADLDISKAIKVARKKHAYTDIEKMYQDEDIDIIYIATPHYLHKPMIEQAFKMGKHIFCEKPVAISIQEARDIYQLDEKYKELKLGFNYNYRYDQKCYRLASALQNNHLGEIYYANCNVYFSRDQSYFEQGLWRSKKQSAGGGTLLIHGSHIMDIMLWALGEPISVMGKIDNLKFKNSEVEDIGFGIIEFESGCYAQINDSMFIKPSIGILGERVELEVFGKKGRCHYKGPWPLSKLKWKGVKKFKIKKNTLGFSDMGRSIKAFRRWVLNDKPYFNTVEESSKVLRMISALYKSSGSGKKELIEKF